MSVRAARTKSRGEPCVVGGAPCATCPGIIRISWNYSACRVGMWPRVNLENLHFTKPIQKVGTESSVKVARLGLLEAGWFYGEGLFKKTNKQKYNFSWHNSGGLCVGGVRFCQKG